jgi:germination protein M
MKRPAMVVLLLGLAVAACAEPIGEGQVITTRPVGSGEGSTTTSSLTTSTAVAASTTTDAAATTTTAVVTTTTVVAGSPVETMGVKVYFMLDDGGTEYRPGPFLVPVYREIPYTQQVATAAVRQLIAGPTADEQASVPGLSSAVPADTILLGITIEDGLARVNLSAEFEGGGGTLSMAARLAQVVFTVSQFPTVREVEFLLDGRPVTIFSSEGIIMDHPVGREDYQDLTPLIFVDDPAYGAPVDNPLVVRGVAAVFEAQFNWVLTNWDGLVIADGTALTDNGMGWGNFEFTIPYEVDREQSGSLIVFDYSPRDGSSENIREHPIRLTP